jgi:hypothetical protein
VRRRPARGWQAELEVRAEQVAAHGLLADLEVKRDRGDRQAVNQAVEDLCPARGEGLLVGVAQALAGAAQLAVDDAVVAAPSGPCRASRRARRCRS